MSKQIKLPGGNGHLPENLYLNDIAYVGAHNAGCVSVIIYIISFIHTNRNMVGSIINRGLQ